MTAACPRDACLACWNATGEIVPAKVNAGGLPLCPRHAHERSMSSSARKLPAADGYERPSVDAVQDRRLLIGITPDGKQPDGARSWEFRPPQPRPDLHHDCEIVMDAGRTLMYQQQPPSFVPGTRPKAAPNGGTSRGAARVEARLDYAAVVGAAGLTERERAVLAVEVGTRAVDAARGLGLTVRQYRTARESGRRKMRRAAK